MAAPPGFILALCLVVGVYAIAHVLPAVRVFDQVEFGWQASCVAAQAAVETLWRGEHEWLWVFGWLPNLLLWLGVACLWIGRRSDARRAGIAAGLAGCLAFAGAALWLVTGEVQDLFIGYYVWTVSMLLFAVLGFWSAAAARPALVLA